MQRITSFESPSRTELLAPPLDLLPVVFIAVTLVLSFTILVLCAIGLGQSTLPPSSPFASFADIFPGQPDDSIKARGFFCIMTPYNAQAESSDEHCNLKLEVGSISEIRVLVSQHLIRQIQFTLREDLLKIGDLMLFLGAPDNYQNAHSIGFVWPGSGIYASADSETRLFSPLSPLRMVSFTDICLPDIESLRTCLETHTRALHSMFSIR